MTHEDIVMALQELGYENGYSFLGSDLQTFKFLVWEHNSPQPSYTEILEANNIVKENILLAEKNSLNIKESAIAKLLKLGLTEDEAKAIAGL